MRIGIDYTAAMWQFAGIGRYTREIVRAIVSLDRQFEYILFFAADGLDQRDMYVIDAHKLHVEHPNVRLVKIPFTPHRLTRIWQRFHIPMFVEWFTGPLDVLHAPDFVLPPTHAHTIATIHDLSFLACPHLGDPRLVRYLKNSVPRSARRANILLVDSEAMRQDLINLMQVDSARVKVVYPGVSEKFRPLSHEACDSVRRKLNIPNNYLLFVSTLSPRKNVVRLIEAFDLVIRQDDVHQNKLMLIIAGKPGWLYDDIFAAVKRLNIVNRVLFLDFLDDNDLPAVFNLANVSVYPSLYEGFGLPALEAMACGTPLVTANNSSLPELVEDAAVLVDAEDVSAIATGIKQVLGNEDLRNALRNRGLERASVFTWKQSAQRVLESYQLLAER